MIDKSRLPFLGDSIAIRVQPTPCKCIQILQRSLKDLIPMGEIGGMLRDGVRECLPRWLCKVQPREVPWDHIAHYLTLILIIIPTSFTRIFGIHVLCALETSLNASGST